MMPGAGGSDDGVVACNSGDGTFVGALDAGIFTLARAFGGSLDEGAFPLSRNVGEGEMGAKESDDRVVAPTFVLDVLGLAG